MKQSSLQNLNQTVKAIIPTRVPPTVCPQSAALSPPLGKNSKHCLPHVQLLKKRSALKLCLYQVSSLLNCQTCQNQGKGVKACLQKCPVSQEYPTSEQVSSGSWILLCSPWILLTTYLVYSIHKHVCLHSVGSGMLYVCVWVQIRPSTLVVCLGRNVYCVGSAQNAFHSFCGLTAAC